MDPSTDIPNQLALGFYTVPQNSQPAARGSATVFEQFIATVLDIVFWCTFIIVFILVSRAMGDNPESYAPSIFDAWSGLIVLFSLPIYLIVSWSVWGQSFGGGLTHTRIVRWDGGKITVFQALGRLYFGMLGTLPLGLGLWWAVHDSRHLTWHDHMARTKVISTRK